MANRRNEVQIEVTSRHQTVSDKTREFAVDRAMKLTRYNDRITSIQVILDEAHDEFVVEMIVKADWGSTLVAKQTGDGYRAALDALLVKLERQVKKDKEKHRNHKHKHDGLKGQADTDSESEEPEADGEPSYDDIVRKRLGE